MSEFYDVHKLRGCAQNDVACFGLARLNNQKILGR
jgi:hypothetical protein